MYTLIQPVLWIVSAVVAAGLGVWVIRARKSGPRTPLVGLAAVAAFAVLVVPSVGFVPAGHRGAVYEWSGGVSPSERGEGITFLAPWVQRMTLVSVRTQREFSSKVYAQSSDLQEITVPMTVNYHVDPARAAELYQTVGPQYRSTLVQPNFFETAKEAIGLVRAEDFAKSRQQIAASIAARLGKRLEPYGIIVELISVEDAVFDPAFTQAVKEKVVAEQEAKEQQNLIVAKEAIKTQTIIEAQAKAQAIKIEADQQAKANLVIARSLTPELLRWKWLVTWNGSLPSTLVGDKDVTLLLGGVGVVGAGYP